mmetsp:Transcript_90557/g.151485  ORF Transcript_90557/g.151485 Transcript_90557/m.151485 type:complete len:90 (-) Transcript_90557:151-420(-)
MMRGGGAVAGSAWSLRAVTGCWLEAVRCQGFVWRSSSNGLGAVKQWAFSKDRTYWGPLVGSGGNKDMMQGNTGQGTYESMDINHISMGG